MHHRKGGKKLNRTSSHRQIMLRNLSVSVLRYKLVKTTLVKAKVLRRYLEPLITVAKNDSVSSRRLVFSRLRDKAVVGELFDKIAPCYKNRSGGYLRILKYGFRSGDSAPMALVELIASQDTEISE